MSIDAATLRSEAEKLNVYLSDRAVSILQNFYLEVCEKNKLFNLTAIDGADNFLNKHFLDSLAALPYIKKGASLCDIGSGAGFPAVPLAAAGEDVKVTALDSTAKKTSFIGGFAKTHSLDNLFVVTGRAEEQKQLFGQFDCVTARAVAPLNILLELSVPLLKTGGLFIAYKTDKEELDASAHALSELRAQLREAVVYKLPNGDPRALLIIEKQAPTPDKYPRKYGIIKKKPL